MSKCYYGIDLGTTFSVISAWKNNGIEVFPSESGAKTVPSYISFTDEEIMVGENAKNFAAFNPSNTIYDIKRIIGRPFDDQSVQEDVKHFPFKVINKDGKPYIEVKFKGEVKQFAPEQLSAMVLSKLKDNAEKVTGDKIKDVVITVPAYFNDAQRDATKTAAIIAGLNPIRLINEPTAAAICFGLENKCKNDAKVLIVDVGGGTTDISLLNIDGGMFEVIATSGNTRCGGEDLDQSLVNHFAEEFRRKNKIDISKNDRAMRRLRTASERAKKTLSSEVSAQIEIDSLFEGTDFSLTISRAKFEELGMFIFREVLVCIDKVLVDAKLDKKSIDEIVLVGGTSLIPKIQSMLKDYFNGKELNKSADVDLSISKGASIQAALLGGVKNEKLDDKLLIDVCPLSLGIEVGGEIMHVLIKRNTTIPCNKEDIFSTAGDNQTAVKISVYEGERQRAKDNNLLGEFMLTDIPPMRRGQPQIKITYSINVNGLLEVTAVEQSSGKSNKITITNDKNRLSKEQIEKMVAEAEKFKDEDEKFKGRVEARGKLESMCHMLAEKEETKGKANEMLMWVQTHANENKEVYDDKLQELMSVAGASGSGGNSGDAKSSNNPKTGGVTVEEVD